jgi:uncharacterized oxidoreductase
MPMIDPERLEHGLVATFAAAGASREEAALIARHLVEASLRGHDSHGVGLMPSYLDAIRTGHMRLGRPLAIIRDLGALVVCDAGHGAGQVMAHEAMKLGIARARAHGMAVIALRDAHHVGRIGHWAEQCAEAGLVSIHFVNVPRSPAVAAFGGIQARLGTNPFAAGFPHPGAPPVIVDFATSRWAVGKVRVAMNKGELLPEGILLDAQGNPSVDPSLFFADPAGVLLPFGEHKGFGLALACELLAGALTGGATQDGSRGESVSNSMLSILLPPGSFAGDADYAERVEKLASWLMRDRESGRAALMPGEPEITRRRQRLTEGLPIDQTTWDAMTTAAAARGISDLLASPLP